MSNALRCCLILLLLTLPGCADSSGSSETSASDETRVLTIVATTGMVADVVRNVAGERAEVRQLMGAGVDPHLYKPTRSDVAAVSEADLVFYNGLYLEGRMSDLFVRAARDGKPVYAVTEQLDESMILEPEAFVGHADPHVWMDVSAWAQTVGVVESALASADPAHAEEYAARASAYRMELASLHDYVTEVIATIPESQRVLITAHDAFNYFGRAYGIEVRGIQGLSTESEAGLEDINRLVDLIVERGVSAVFVETSVSDRNVTALIEGARAGGVSVKIGGRLFSDATGPEGTYRGTYIGMIDHNATEIARALGGTAPEGGLNGRLTGDEG